MQLIPTPTDRLQLSRERLRQALTVGSVPAGESASSTSADFLTEFVSGFISKSAVEILREAARVWWTQHPLQQLLGSVGDRLKAHVADVTRRHPVGVVVGACVVGGLIVWSRPWRWIAAPGSFASILSLVTILARSMNTGNSSQTGPLEGTETTAN